MGNLGGWEIVILVGVLLLLFGAKRLPDMARSIGQSARVFKGEMKGMRGDDEPATPPATPPAATALPPTQPTAPATPDPAAATTPTPTAESSPPSQQGHRQPGQ